MALAEDLKPQNLPAVRIVSADDQEVCRDCGGALVVVDDDGSVSGTAGGLIDCVCVELAMPPGFVECRACASLPGARSPAGGVPGLLRRVGNGAGVVPPLRRLPAAGERRPGGLLLHGGPPRTAGESLGSCTVTGPWGNER